jgi:PAS domain-containing protein
MITPKPFKYPDSRKYVGDTRALVELSLRMNDGFYIFDQKTLITMYANRSILTVLGYNVAQIKSLGDEWIKEVVHADDFAIVSRHIAHYAHLKSGQRIRVVYRIKDAKDIYKVVETTAFLINAAEGNLIMGISRIIDSTEPKNLVDSGNQADHRCVNCDKLLGKNGLLEQSVEVKCGRCGEYNTISIS